MALYIPDLSKSKHPAELEHKPGEERLGLKRHGVSWSDSDIRHGFYVGLQRGKFGTLTKKQIEGIQKIVDDARGADRELEPSKVLRAIHDLQQGRIDLEIDHSAMENIVAHLSQGPDES